MAMTYLPSALLTSLVTAKSERLRRSPWLAALVILLGGVGAVLVGFTGG